MPVASPAMGSGSRTPSRLCDVIYYPAASIGQRDTEWFETTLYAECPVTVVSEMV